VLGSFRELGLLDLQVYRMGGAAVAHRASLYSAAYPHDGLLFTYPPFAALVFLPLHLLGWTGGAIAITAASVAALVRSCALLTRGTDRDTVLAGSTRPVVFAGLVIFSLVIWPSRSTFEYGQINFIIMWLVLEDFLGSRRSPRWDGVPMGLAAAIKLTPAFFIPFALVCGQYRRARNATAMVVVAFALGFLAVPDEALSYWTSHIFDPSRVGSPAFLSNQSIYGMVSRLVGRPAGPLTQLVAGLVLGGAILFVGRRLWDLNCRTAALATAALGPLLVSPISWTHHWVWMTLFLAALGLSVPPDARLLRGARVALVAMLVTISLPRPMNVFPSGGDQEYQFPLGVQVATSAYVLFGLALLAYLFAYSRCVAADRERRDAPITPARSADAPLSEPGPRPDLVR
jgi:alpha-1,2-mannosyltransferase